MRTVVLTIVVNDDEGHNEAAAKDTLGDAARELERAGQILGFRFGGTEPAGHVLSPDGTQVPDSVDLRSE